MIRSSRWAEASRAALVTGVAAALILSAPLSASASPAEEGPVEETWLDFEPTTVVAVYGDGWSLPFTGKSFFAANWNAAALTHEFVGGPSGYTPLRYSYTSSFSNDVGMTGFLYPDYAQKPLDAGTYTAKLDASAVYWYGSGSTHYHGDAEATLTVSKAKLTTDARVQPDPSNPSISLISAWLGGTFVENYYPSADAGAAPSPSGVWTFTVTDSTGDVAFETSVARELGDHAFGASTIWAGAKPGEQYIATAEFAPNGGSEKNFSVEPAPDFDFTGAALSRTVPASTAGDPTASEPPGAPDFSVPVWWIVLMGIVLAALIACAVWFAVRLGRSSDVSR